jgi:hypothetical protein
MTPASAPSAPTPIVMRCPLCQSSGHPEHECPWRFILPQKTIP